MSERSALIIGSGGREHALGRAVAPSVDTVYFAPGNAGTAMMEKGVNVDVGTYPVDFAKEQGVGLTIIGPEAPLVDGLANQFRAEDLAVLGPNKNAAQLEASKRFSYEFMTRHGIPCPKTELITDSEQINAFCQTHEPGSVVLKADGLAGGKGVVLPDSMTEMKGTLYSMLSGERFDGAGRSGVLGQERLTGPEISVFVVSDGERFSLLPFSQDHKRLKDGDEGPNTGGMGSYAPVPETIVSPEQAQKIHDIAEKTITGAKADGMPYHGILYIGVMLAKEYDGDPVVIEYNVRFGDPEAQVVLPILQQAGVSAYDLFESTASGFLDRSLLPSKALLGKSALTVCLAAHGYPDSPRKGDEISGLDGVYDGVLIHHGGTQREDERIVTSGGRVLYVTGMGETVDEAAARAYTTIGPHAIHFAGMQYRTDIGYQTRSNAQQPSRCSG